MLLRVEIQRHDAVHPYIAVLITTHTSIVKFPENALGTGVRLMVLRSLASAKHTRESEA